MKIQSQSTRHLAAFVFCICYIYSSYANASNSSDDSNMATSQNRINPAESFLIDALCNQHMLANFQPFLQKLSLYGLVDPPDAETSQRHRLELESLWSESIAIYEKELTSRLKLTKQKDSNYQIDSDRILNQLTACKEVTQFEYYEQAVTKIVYQINDHYLPQD